MDVGSRYTFVIPVERKAPVPQAITAALESSRNIRSTEPNIIHSEKAKEYVAEATRAAASKFGTSSTTTVPYNPEEIRIAQRANRTIMNGVRCALVTQNMSDEYWPEPPEEIADVVFKNNLLMHSATGKHPTRHGRTQQTHYHNC